MIVIDASAMIEFLLGQPFSPAGAAVEHHLPGGAAAPHLIDHEVGQAVRRLVLSGLVAVHPAERMLANLGSLRVTRHPADRLLQRRSLALRDNLTFYDASYVALAERVAAPLLTADERLANAPGLGIEVVFAASGG